DVWGQADFTKNGCNRGGPPSAETLCHEGPHTGVAIDDEGNLWVADPGNARVLRFPRIGSAISHTADVVLGQPGFTSNTRGDASRSLSEMAYPLELAFDRTTRRLYVADVAFGVNDDRVLEFRAPFFTGQAAQRALPINLYCDFDYPGLAPMSPALATQIPGLWVENSCWFSELFDLDTAAPVLRKRAKVVTSDGIDVDRDGNLYVIGKWNNLYRFPRLALSLDCMAADFSKVTAVKGSGPVSA